MTTSNFDISYEVTHVHPKDDSKPCRYVLTTLQEAEDNFTLWSQQGMLDVTIIEIYSKRTEIKKANSVK